MERNHHLSLKSANYPAILLTDNERFIFATKKKFLFLQLNDEKLRLTCRIKKLIKTKMNKPLVMKKVFLTFTIMFFTSTLTCVAQNTTLKGKIIDEGNNEPLAFASVALIKDDSILVSSAMADADGLFTLSATPDTYKLKISFIGYKDVYKELHLMDKEIDAGIILIEKDAHELQEVVVKSQLPKTKLEGDAIVTNIVGSVLEHAGNANDVLAKVPGMISINGELQVLGRGTPIYYINGRKVTDESELRNLMSEEIKSIDVVSNPGAIYGGDVRCVVRIKTIKRQGEGLSFALTSQAKKYTTCRYADPSWTVLDVNYRVKNWDFFGKFVYWAQHGFQVSDMYGEMHLKQDGRLTEKIQAGDLHAQAYMGGLQEIIGANWQINENHSLGFKVEQGNNLFTDNNLTMTTDYIVDGVQEDHLYSVSRAKSPVSNQTTGNIYYDGNFNKLNVNFNADFLIGNTKNENKIKEESWTEPRQLVSNSKARSDMYAAKLILSYPIWKGMLQFGSEEIYFIGKETYSINFDGIPASDGKDEENTIAGFAQYAMNLPFGQLTTGIRYEHVDFSFRDYINPKNNLNRKQDDWFPSISFATKIGKVNLLASYTGKTNRPQLHNLSSEISYDNRYTYQCGDPKLLSEKRHTASLQASWKWLSFSSAFETVDNAIEQWALPYDYDDGIVLIKYSNLDATYSMFNMFLNASPSFGVWYPRYTIGFQKPHLHMNVLDPREATGERIVTRDEPMYILQANNAFRFKHNWQIEVNYQYMSTCSQGIANITKPKHDLEVAVQKSFLKDDALTFKLSYTDILNTYYHIATDFGSYQIRQSLDRRSPGIVLRASYRFNSAKSKYKGTGAGQSVKERM